MTEDPTQLRHEVKIVCERAVADTVESQLLLSTAAIRPLYPDRVVQSIYFDTERGRFLDDNITGISNREKLRFRWYGAESASATGTLEKKIRHSNLGRKQTHRLEAALAIAGKTTREFATALREACSPTWRPELDGLRPVQWIRYQRRYLTTFDRRVRVTIDNDVRTVDLRSSPVLDPRRTEHRRAITIFELKAPQAHEAAIADLLASVRALRSKCSKFVLASAPDEF